MSTIFNLATGETVTQIKRNDEPCFSGCGTVLIDLKLRVLTCRECGAVVDAFNWAARMAREESILMQNISNLKTVYEERTKTLDGLRAEETRIKGRIRSAKDSFFKSAGL